MDNDNYSNFKSIIQIENAKKNQIKQQEISIQKKEDERKTADLVLLEQSEAVQLFKKISNSGDARWSDVPLFSVDKTFRSDIYQVGSKIFDYTPAVISFGEYRIQSDNGRTIPACFLLYNAHYCHTGDNNYDLNCYSVCVAMDDSKLFILKSAGLKKVENVGEDIAKALLSMYDSDEYRPYTIDDRYANPKIACLFCGSECVINESFHLKNSNKNYTYNKKDINEFKVVGTSNREGVPPFSVTCKHCGKAYMSYGTLAEWDIHPRY